MKKFLITTTTILAFSATKALACAQGCGMFNVGTSSLIPNQQGGIAFVQYDYNTQSRNWGGEHKSDAHNHDLKIQTQTITAGAQYMFDRKWGLNVRVPYVTRAVNSKSHESDGMGGEMTVYDFKRNAELGDIRVSGIYSGFFDDMSTGITFGLKLPTGRTNNKSFDLNTQIGNGSTDVTFGAYHLGKFDAVKNLTYFAQASLDQPFLTKDKYRPGYEISASVGTSYNFGSVLGLKKLAPIAQFTASQKGKDAGEKAADHNLNSGYSQVFFNPAIEVGVGEYRLYADVGFPIYRQVNGNQLVSQNTFKVIVGKSF